MKKSHLMSMEQDCSPMGTPRIRMRWMISQEGFDDLSNLRLIQDKRLRHGQSGAELTIVEISISDHTDRIDVSYGGMQKFIPGLREVELDITFNLLSTPNSVSFQDADFFTDFHVVI